MCKFCDALLSEKEITWSVRSTYADDNIHEAIYLNKEDSHLYEEYCLFILTPYKHKGNIKVCVEYEQQISTNKEKVIIHPFSESQQFNFCPMCGKQISQTIEPFEDKQTYGMHIDEEE